ncbi:MAG: RHS repeat-associated core domain-containing protein [Actinomycetota bacterium]|nr:RHS repeat-associated core domain-containing protein [Actinomycetota bacterium]
MSIQTPPTNCSDVATFAYDPGGRRISETGPGQVRAFSWDGLGRLAGIERDTESGETTATRLVVDALGDLAAVDDQPLLWDPTSMVSQLRWAGGTAIIGRDQPWATAAPSGEAGWLDTDWQGSTGDLPRDPWGANGQVTAPDGADPVRLGWRGEVEVDGLVWLRHRPYDPHTRAFLSTDPLPGVPGSTTSANPYHYANNDPIGFIDPLGLRPLTDADLRAFREAAGRNLFERGGDWAQDNWEYLAAGAAVVGGVALMATGVGGPAGLAQIAGGGALIGGGTSAALQKFTTGGVDWGRVGIDAAIGGAAGPIGAGAGWAAARGLQAASPLARGIAAGVVAGGSENLVAGAATRAVYGEDPFNPSAMGKDLLVGGTTGGLGGRLGARPVAGQPATLVATEIRFSQASVNQAEEIIISMRQRGWRGSRIDVVQMPDATVTALDNTRLLAARYTETPVKANVHSYSDPIDPGRMSSLSDRKGNVPRTWGEGVEHRIGRQNRICRETYPYGSNIIGWSGN